MTNEMVIASRLLVDDNYVIRGDAERTNAPEYAGRRASAAGERRQPRTGRRILMQRMGLMCRAPALFRSSLAKILVLL
jgi:hypothetical protein